MNAETGIETIVSRIESDVEAELAASREAFEKELAALAAEHSASLRNIKDDAQRRAAEAAEKELQRGHSSSVSASRAILAQGKSELVRRAFELAAKSFASMEEGRYLSIMAPMLAAGAAEFPDGTALTLVVPEGHPVSGETLAAAAKVRTDNIQTSSEFDAGFLLLSEELELNCIPSKLIGDRYEELSPRVAAILFEREA